jgi:hypothetical protein
VPKSSTEIRRPERLQAHQPLLHVGEVVHQHALGQLELEEPTATPSGGRACATASMNPIEWNGPRQPSSGLVVDCPERRRSW